MAIIQTVTPKEDFIVEMNGGYGICFTEVQVGINVESGMILETASLAISAASTSVFGIATESASSGEFTRIMVRGNPSKINAQSLDYADADAESIDALLAEKSIIVVNH